MSYTNSTTNYNLPLYQADDKPTYESDWNGAMNAIDTAIHEATEGEGGQALEVANQALTTAQQAQVTANAAQASADTGVKLTVTTQDPGEGVPLAANQMIAVVDA